MCLMWKKRSYEGHRCHSKAVTQSHFQGKKITTDWAGGNHLAIWGTWQLIRHRKQEEHSSVCSPSPSVPVTRRETYKMQMNRCLPSRGQHQLSLIVYQSRAGCGGSSARGGPLRTVGDHLGPSWNDSSYRHTHMQHALNNANHVSSHTTLPNKTLVASHSIICNNDKSQRDAN